LSNEHSSLRFLRPCILSADQLDHSGSPKPGYLKTVKEVFHETLSQPQITHIRDQVLINAQQRGFATDQLGLSLECYTLGVDQAQSDQDEQDDALRKLASVLKEQIPTIPEGEGDVDTIRAWFLDLANQPDIQAVTQVSLAVKQLAVIPPEIGGLVNLKKLDLRYNRISVIPPEIFALENLQLLALSYNNISEIPPAIGALVNLQGLFLDHNQIAEIQPAISVLVNLEHLALSQNQISVIPAEIGALVNLKCLWLNRNQISVIPDAISGLVNLEWLHLSGNQISVIPPAIFNLVDWDIFNYLDTSDSCVSAFAHLRLLDLRDNQISEISARMGDLVNGTEVIFIDHGVVIQDKPTKSCSLM
jgi:hypothetical protein